MNVINEGIQGAKVQSWKKANARDVLKRIVEQNPGASKAEIHEKLSRKVLADEGMLHSIVEYWFSNNYNSLIVQMPDRIEAAQSSKARSEQVSKLAEQVQQKIKQKAAIMLLDMKMPNGKNLKDCTGSDCKMLSGAIGPWLEMVSDKVRPNQTVGSKLTEQDIQGLYEICANR